MKRLVAAWLCLIVLLAGCAPTISSESAEQAPIRLADLGVVDFHSEEQQAYLDDGYLFPRGKGVKEWSRPNAITLQWESDLAGAFTVRLSESADMAGAKEYTTQKNELSLYNLKVATTYYWTVAVGDTVSEVASFATADCLPRNIYCDGITNMRDIGGWTTADGRRVKQGLLYRSGQWGKPNATSPMITAAGVATMKELGIVTELDLRNEASGLDPCPVDGVAVIHKPMVASRNFYGTNREMVVEIFEVLANETNYPMVFHCAIGTDRTGYIAFLINALLGVEEESLYRDYLFSNYGNIGNSRAITGVKLDYMNRILEYGSGTGAENCEAFLLDIGVKQEHIDAVRNILLD